MNRRIKLLIAYDGRPFRGWQSQTGGDTVQDRLETAFSRLLSGRVPVHGSGRTDAGVHALAQIAHADVPAGRLKIREWVPALNAHLPPEIRVMRCQWASPEFHARFNATGKVYRYRLWNGPVLPPMEIGRVWHVFKPLNLERLAECARQLEGTHDFAGFAANRGEGGNDTVRTLRRIEIKGRAGSAITLTFDGDGFLYRMVRLLTGSMVRCARGKAECAWLAGLLDQPKAPLRKTHFMAPAEGLTLVRVLYDKAVDEQGQARADTDTLHAASSI